MHMLQSSRRSTGTRRMLRSCTTRVCVEGIACELAEVPFLQDPKNTVRGVHRGWRGDSMCPCADALAMTLAPRCDARRPGSTMKLWSPPQRPTDRKGRRTSRLSTRPPVMRGYELVISAITTPCCLQSSILDSFPALKQPAVWHS